MYQGDPTANVEVPNRYKLGDVFASTLDHEEFVPTQNGMNNCLPIALNNAAGVPLYETLYDFFIMLAKSNGTTEN